MCEEKTGKKICWNYLMRALTEIFRRGVHRESKYKQQKNLFDFMHKIKALTEK